MDWNGIGQKAMHFSPAALALSTTLLLVSSIGHASTDYRPTAASMKLVERGEAAEQAGDARSAYDLYISALAYDPHNAAAFIAMAELSQGEDLYGSAIRYYSRALELQPNNEAALAGQGEAYVAKGAVTRAEGNLQKLQLVCASPCAPAEKLAASIAAGPPQRVVKADALKSDAIVEADSETQVIQGQAAEETP